MSAALSRPNLIARGVSLVALALVVMAVVLLLQGPSTYSLRLQMSNANGLRPGSQVLLGGVPVGTVSSLDLGPGDSVIAKLSLNPKQVKIGRGAHASIIAANLLGEEYVSLAPGDSARPLPSGTLIGPSQITVPTDLDQIVDVFNASTRERLAILINEMGIAVAGRRNDVSSILRQLPLSAVAATKLLDQLVQDNHTLADTIAHSNEFIARVDQQQTDLGHVIDAASGAATTAAQEASNLSQTLVSAPAALLAIQRYATAQTRFSKVLVRPAELIQQAAGPLDTLLAHVHPFEQAAVPALDRAASVAPLLTKLAVEGTPIITQAVPTVTALAKIATLAGPLTYWLNASIADLLGALNGWDRAIQFRDGLGHIFHAEVALDPSVIVNLAKLGLPASHARRPSPTGTQGSPVLGSGAPAGAPRGSATSSAAPAAPPAAGSPVAGLLSTLAGALHGGSGQPGGGSGSSSPQNLSSLLNYLLGK